MENMTMTPVTYWHGDFALADCATSATALRTFDVQGVAVRDAVVRGVETAAFAAAKPAIAAFARKRDGRDATAIATGHAGLIAGARPGSPAWSPPL